MPDAWYETVPVGDPILQGEFVLDCPTLTLPSDLSGYDIGQTPPQGKASIERKLHNAVIMTQSCDLFSKGLDTVLLCPYYPFKEFVQRTRDYHDLAAKDSSLKNSQSIKNVVEKELKALSAGARVAYHLLDKDDTVGFTDFQVVELNSAFSIRRSIVEQLVARQRARTRLKSPYLEHLSQAYATVFMRVGLPKNISSSVDAAFYEPSAQFRASARAVAEAAASAAATAQAQRATPAAPQS